jgi:hypothetical protein
MAGILLVLSGDKADTLSVERVALRRACAQSEGIV